MTVLDDDMLAIIEARGLAAPPSSLAAHDIGCLVREIRRLRPVLVAARVWRETPSCTEHTNGWVPICDACGDDCEAITALLHALDALDPKEPAR